MTTDSIPPPEDDAADLPSLSGEPSIWYRSGDFDVRLDAGDLAVAVLDEREIVITRTLLNFASQRLASRLSDLEQERAMRKHLERTGGGDPK